MKVNSSAAINLIAQQLS